MDYHHLDRDLSDRRGFLSLSLRLGQQRKHGQARAEQGWDYAEEYGEAMDLALAGVEPRTMSGHAVLGPQSFAGV